MDNKLNDEINDKTKRYNEEVEKAKRYAQEPERIQFNRFEAQFRGEIDIHTTNYDNGEWHCTCRFFNDWGDCDHTMAMQRILGVLIPAAHRHGIPAGIGTSSAKHASPESTTGSTTIAENISEDPIIGKELSAAQTQPNTTIRIRGIRITEIPLTAQNLTTIISAVTDLYTKCWLIAKGRSADLIEYTQTHNFHSSEEASLVITKVTYNSPFSLEWKLDASPQGVMVALATGIDAIAQAPKRLENAELENRSKELSIKLMELEALSSLSDREQSRQIAVQKADLELEKQRLELLAKRFEIERNRLDYALDTARAMVDLLRPEADQETKGMLLQTLIPNLLQLGNGKGLELALPEKASSQKESMTADD